MGQGCTCTGKRLACRDEGDEVYILSVGQAQEKNKKKKKERENAESCTTKKKNIKKITHCSISRTCTFSLWKANPKILLIAKHFRFEGHPKPCNNCLACRKVSVGVDGGMVMVLLLTCRRRESGGLPRARNPLGFGLKSRPLHSASDPRNAINGLTAI